MRRGAPGAENVRSLAARTGRLAAGLLALGALALLLSQSGRLPGPAGDAIRGNESADRDATALFYTEVDGWLAGVTEVDGWLAGVANNTCDRRVATAPPANPRPRRRTAPRQSESSRTVP